MVKKLIHRFCVGLLIFPPKNKSKISMESSLMTNLSDGYQELNGPTSHHGMMLPLQRTDLWLSPKSTKPGTALLLVSTRQLRFPEALRFPEGAFLRHCRIT
jgi:hypothetical protein